MEFNFDDTEDYQCVFFNSRADWLNARRQSIGASDASAILHISPWTTERKLYDEKVSTEPIAEKGNNDTKRGTESESHIRSLYAIEHNSTVIDGTNVMFISRKYPWMHCTLDGIIKNDGYDPAILEIKSVRPNTFAKLHEWEKSDKVPDYYLVQVLHQLAVTNWNEARLVARVINTFGGTCVPRSFEREFVFQRNDYINEIAGLIELEKKFWFNNVVAKNPPKEFLPTI